MKNVKTTDIERSWYLIDAERKILARLSVKVALSGKKEKQKKYYHHSQFPGGLKVKTAQQVRENKPEEVIRHSVRGMLPKTKLGKLMLKKLYVFKDDKHPYSAKFKDAKG